MAEKPLRDVTRRQGARDGRTASGRPFRAPVAMLLPVLLLAACGHGPAPASGAPVHAADGVPGPAVRFRFVPPQAGPGGPGLTVEVAHESGARTVRPGDFRRTEEVPAPHTGWFPTPGRGLLRIRASLARPSAGALGSGGMELPLQADASYEVSVFTWRPDPRVPPPPCMGCVREARFPLAADPGGGVAAGDSLVIRAVRVPVGQTGPVH